MGRERLDMHRIQELVRLCRLGVSDRRISRVLGMGLNTVRAYRAAVSKASLLEGPVEALPTFEEWSQPMAHVRWLSVLDRALLSIACRCRTPGDL